LRNISLVTNEDGKERRNKRKTEDRMLKMKGRQISSPFRSKNTKGRERKRARKKDERYEKSAGNRINYANMSN
jgi:hypothetical protein